jgi:hypothetical protein
MEYGLSASADGPYFLYQQGRNDLFFYQRRRTGMRISRFARNDKSGNGGQ